MKISRKERKENRKNRKGLIINSLRTLRKKTLRPLRETFFPKYLNIYIINCLSSYKICCIQALYFSPRKQSIH
jgi:hypothetical protein